MIDDADTALLVLSDQPIDRLLLRWSRGIDVESRTLPELLVMRGSPAVIFEHVKARLGERRFSFLPTWVEWRLRVEDVLRGGHVDVEDSACALATALVAAGHECRLVAHGFGSAVAQHLVVQVHDERAGWVYADVHEAETYGKLAMVPTVEFYGPRIRP